MRFGESYKGISAAIRPTVRPADVDLSSPRSERLFKDLEHSVHFNESLYVRRKAEGAPAAELADISVTNRQVVHNLQVLKQRYARKRARKIYLPPVRTPRMIRPRARGIRARRSPASSSSSGGGSDGDGDGEPPRRAVVGLRGAA